MSILVLFHYQSIFVLFVLIVFFNFCQQLRGLYEKFIWWHHIYYWWLFWPVGFKHCNTDAWTARETMLEKTTHLVTLHESILVRLWNFQPIHIYDFKKLFLLNKTEYMCFNQAGDISTLDGTSLKLVDKFTYLGSSVSSTEKDIDTRLTKAWTAIDKLSIIWKSDLTDKMKRSFFQAVVVSILLYECTTWTLTKTTGEEARRQLYKNVASNIE